MNIIQIVSDTFRRDHLGCYGNDWIHTEHLDRFAEDSVVFDRAYIASYATIPCRHDLFSGRYTFVYSTWSPLPRDEVILSQLLRQAGYTTMLIADTFHMIKDGHYFDRGFDGWWWIRGQENDRYMTNPTKNSEQRKRAVGERYLKNISLRRFEEDYFVAQTMTSAEKWLELNYDQHDKFFLHVDTFDPHEPWDPPRWYTNMYDPEWSGGEVVGGAYIPLDWRDWLPVHRRPLTTELGEEEINRLRVLYAGEITMVDRWVGRLLQKIKDLGLFENTTIIFTSDHGTYIGEHGYVGKRSRFYEEVAHVPLMIRLPDSERVLHNRCEELVQSPDLMPTILEMASVHPPPTVQARSLLPVVRDKESLEREIAVSSSSLAGHELPYWITVTSKEWALLAARKNTPSKDEFGRKIESELYHLSTDVNETHNLYKDEKEVAEELRSKMIEFLRSMGAKEEILNNWT